MRFVVCVLAALVASALAASPFTSAASARNELLKLARDVNADQASTWTAELNERFAGMNFEEIKKQLGALLDGEKLPPITHDLTNFEAPDAWDAREAFPACKSVGEVRDQSACGSCWAMAVSEAATDRLCIGTKGDITTHLSSADMLSCCSSCGYGCQGGYPSAAWSWLKSTGIVSGGNYNDFSGCFSYPMQNCGHHVDEYEPPCSSLDYDTPKCTKKCDSKAPAGMVYADDKVKFKSTYSVWGEKNLQAELMKNGPIGVTFTVYADFLNYKSGVYAKSRNPGEVLGGHAIKLIGWGVDEAGTKYWTLVNSWNESWGEKGLYRMKRGTDECGIESDGSAGVI